MADPIDTTGPRPWPGTATIDDIRPGVILTQHHVEGGNTQQWVVVSEVKPDSNEIYLVTPEQAARFTRKEIAERLLLDGIPKVKYLSDLGIQPWPIPENWVTLTYCTVDGMIPERKGNHQRPFTAIELPDEINREGLELLLHAMYGGSPSYEWISVIVNIEDPRPGLLALCAKLDERMVTILVLRFGLNGEEPMTYKKIGEYLSISGGLVREKLSAALAKMRGEAHRLR